MGSLLPTATVLAEFRNIQNIVASTPGSEPIAVDFKGTELRMVKLKHLFKSCFRMPTENCIHKTSLGTTF